MFKERDDYFYIEEFENYGIKAIYSKKNAGNMSDYCGMEASATLAALLLTKVVS